MTCEVCGCAEPDLDLAPPCWCLVCDCSGVTLQHLIDNVGERVALVRMGLCRAAGCDKLLPVARR